MTLRISRPAALTSLALAMAACHAHAESTDTVVVTATRTAQPLANVISDTITINAEQIAESGAGSIVDLLQRQRGIEIARNGGAGTSSSVYIRGANSNQNIVLVDGVRIGSSTTGAANWSAIPLTAIDHIEIVYGPLSSLYGADAIGGVIQIFTRKGQGAPAVTAFAGYGSDKTREVDATLSGATGGEHSFSYAISAGKEKSDGYSATRPGLSSYNKDDDGYDRENVSGQFGLQIAPGYEAGALFLHSKLDSQYDNGASAYDVRSKAELQTAAIYGKAKFVSNVDTLLQYSQSEDKGQNWGSAAASGYSRIDTRQTTITLQNDIRIGEDIVQVLYDHRKEEVSTNGADAMNRDRTTNSWAASYNARRGASLLNASVRRDNAVYGSKNTGSIGYGYDITPQLRATASYGTSFRAPTYNELYYPGYGNPANKPEEGKNAEIGLRWDDGVNALSANYYHNKLTDMLVNTTPCPYAGYTFGCAYNVNKAMLEGVTIAGTTKLAGINLAASIDLQDPKDETTDKRLARRAKKHGNVTADYRIGALKAGVELEFSGDRFDDAANKNRLGGYGLVNLYATYAVNKDWSALVRWNNVGDKQYDLARYYVTPGSKVFAGIRYGYK
ncbi:MULTISPECIES: TonB-dependent receptor domain-containing protein [unclassified Duganella]|jgi:vitamin B12 transporter|uniref:TonB-dependent receptor domain-containing protein n=1 Tax=unclassified Duganella TaxID=2636909 RepID=UPI000890F39E|nr:MULTISPECIES: TonB-dependent receptor [unclassified Duganella]SDH64804.1 vitamin B12 transporter [Duganella sp. OV458]SDK75154.1 vitamin B12 transporter [Duganella sp. OV510]